MAHKEAAEVHHLRVGNRGRLVLPAVIRRRLRWRDGDRLVATVEGDGTIRLASLKQQLEKARGLYAHVAPGRRLSEELIRERRREARRNG